MIAQIKHGYSNRVNSPAKPEYYVWLAMKSRCFNVKNKRYPLYGGRGITVCDKWLKFEGFLEDMGNRPSDKYSLDRYPNKDGNYEPGNCRWATIYEQNTNTSRNKYIEYNGVTKTLEDWARHFNADPGNIRKRFNLGYTTEEVFHHYTYNFKKRKK